MLHESLSIMLLPCIMKWSGLQDLLIWLLVIFSSEVSWNCKFLSPLHVICRICEIEFRLNSNIWGKIQVWYGVLLEVWKKGHKLVLKNMAGILNKNLQKQSPIGVCQNSCSPNMQQMYRGTPMWKYDFNKVAMQLYWNHTSIWVFSCIFTAYLRNTFFEEHPWETIS